MSTSTDKSNLKDKTPGAIAFRGKSNHCCVPGCKGRVSSEDSSSVAQLVGISCHKFPKDEELRRKWVDAVNSPNITMDSVKSQNVCGKHFKPSDYINDMRCRLAPHLYSERRLLGRTAIPSQLLPNSFEESSTNILDSADASEVKTQKKRYAIMENTEKHGKKKLKSTVQNIKTEHTDFETTESEFYVNTKKDTSNDGLSCTYKANLPQIKTEQNVLICHNQVKPLKKIIKSAKQMSGKVTSDLSDSENSKSKCGKKGKDEEVINTNQFSHPQIKTEPCNVINNVTLGKDSKEMDCVNPLNLQIKTEPINFEFRETDSAKQISQKIKTEPVEIRNAETNYINKAAESKEISCTNQIVQTIKTEALDINNIELNCSKEVAALEEINCANQVDVQQTKSELDGLINSEIDCDTNSAINRLLQIKTELADLTNEPVTLAASGDHLKSITNVSIQNAVECNSNNRHNRVNTCQHLCENQESESNDHRTSVDPESELFNGTKQAFQTICVTPQTERSTSKSDAVKTKTGNKKSHETSSVLWPFKCGFKLCRMEFQLKSDAIDHIENHFSTVKDTPGKRFRCDICQKRFSKLSLIVKHLECHLIRYEPDEPDSEDDREDYESSNNFSDNVEIENKNIDSNLQVFFKVKTMTSTLDDSQMKVVITESSEFYAGNKKQNSVSLITTDLMNETTTYEPADKLAKLS